MPKMTTAKIGPVLQMETRPKLSSLAFLSLRMEESPTPIAMMNGTVIGPVVTPPASNATERNDSGAKTETIKRKRYRNNKMLDKRMWNKIRAIAAASMSPTPIDTVIIRVEFGMEGT